jgi:hypothetical protein
MVTAARNKLGNIVYTANRYGAVARTLVNPTQPRTDLQITRRNTFTALSVAWATLSASQQAAWAAWATTHPITDVFGQSNVLAGNAAYMAVGARLKLLGQSVPTTPPADGSAQPAAAASAAAVTATDTITVTTASQTATTGWYVAWTCGAISQGKTFVASQMRVIGVVATSGAATTAVFHPNAYNGRLTLAVGGKVPVFVERYDKNGLYVDVQRYDVTAT